MASGAETATATAPLPATAPDAGQSLLLNVVVNGRNHDNIQEIAGRQGALLLTREQITASGLILNGPYTDTGGGLIALSSIKGWTWRLDENTQTLFIQVPSGDQIAQQFSSDVMSAGDVAPHSDRGAVLNYDAQVTDYNGQDSSSLLGDLRLFGDSGVLTNSAIQTHNPYLDRTVRLESTYSRSDISTLRTWNTGDYISGGLDWTRPVRMGGVQMTTNFGLRPDLVTFPRPGISGEVAVPSSVDIYVNGLHQMTRQVDAGPFDITSLPVTTGGGDVSMVVKDANGRQTTQTLPFYASSSMLRQGLESLSVEAGSVRRGYASRSADYTGGAASASYRRGVWPAVTLETHLEATQKLVMGGIGADLLVRDLGVLSGSLAASRYGEKQGQQYGLGFSHTVHTFSYGFSALRADADFYDIAAAYGDSTAGTTLRASLGFPVFPGNGSFGLVYARKLVNYYNSYNYESERIATSSLSGTYSAPLPALAAFGYLTLLHDFDYDKGNSLYVGISIPFGKRSTISTSASVSHGDSYQTVQAQQSAVQHGDIGWSLATQNGAVSRQNAGLEYKADWGLIGTEVEQGSSGHAVRASARGSLAAIGGHVFAANTIENSFALVDTDGLPGITVLQENRPVGKTDRNGLMFIEDMRAYESNRLSVDPNDVPMDVALTNEAMTVRPRDQSGVIARFPIRRSRGATLLLVDAQHKPLPLGSVAILVGSGAQAMVGYDGQTFFEDLAEHNQLKVETTGRPDCTLSFDYHPQANVLPQIGPLTCNTGA
ncbi:fimbria/pilus outer membrane usher protein [Enterobacteriales bacterium SAP-6]|uniref:Fimbria/pilus outer membrane usher protein n=2 Tax=Acerihabitans arboris TaxID=2691583 RepID=A0A845SNP6_9GAMM|nr:fimbria/pilus outer membrane usher protein [Acerihabitans arboris]